MKYFDQSVFNSEINILSSSYPNDGNSYHHCSSFYTIDNIRCDEKGPFKLCSRS